MTKTKSDYIVTSITNIINFRDKNIDRIAACLIIAKRFNIDVGETKIRSLCKSYRDFINNHEYVLTSYDSEKQYTFCFVTDISSEYDNQKFKNFINLSERSFNLLFKKLDLTELKYKCESELDNYSIGDATIQQRLINLAMLLACYDKYEYDKYRDSYRLVNIFDIVCHIEEAVSYLNNNRQLYI